MRNEFDRLCLPRNRISSHDVFPSIKDQWQRIYKPPRQKHVLPHLLTGSCRYPHASLWDISTGVVRCNEIQARQNGFSGGGATFNSPLHQLGQPFRAIRRQASPQRREANAGLLNCREREGAETTVRVATGKEDGCRGSRRLLKSRETVDLQGSIETGGYPHVGIPLGIPKNVKDNHSQVGLSLKN